MDALHCDTYEGYIQAAREALALPECDGAQAGDDQYLHPLNDLVMHVRFSRWVEYYEPHPREPLNQAQRSEARRLAGALQGQFDRWYAAHQIHMAAESNDDRQLFASMPVPSYLKASVTEAEVIAAVKAAMVASV